jgi:hypothetical protein
MYGSHIQCVVMGMVFNATFNNISVISVKQTGSADVKSVAIFPLMISPCQILDKHTIFDMICLKWTSHYFSHQIFMSNLKMATIGKHILLLNYVVVKSNESLGCSRS